MESKHTIAAGLVAVALFFGWLALAMTAAIYEDAPTPDERTDR